MTYNPQGQQSFVQVLQQLLGGNNVGQLPQIQPLKQQSPMDDMIGQALQQPQGMQQPQQQQGTGVVGSMMQGQSLGDSLSKSKLGQFAKMFLGI